MKNRGYGRHQYPPPQKHPYRKWWQWFFHYIKSYPQRRRAKKKEQTPADKATGSIARATWAMVLFTAILTGTTYLTLKQIQKGGADTTAIAKASKKQAKAAKSFSKSAGEIDTKIGIAEGDFAQMATNSEDAIKATQEQMRLDQRAWLGVDHWIINTFELGKPVHVDIWIANKGKTPALQLEAGGTEGLVIPNDTSRVEVAREIESEFEKIQFSRAGAISPDGTKHFWGDGMPPDKTFNSIVNGTSTWYVVQKIKYNDVLGASSG